MRSSLFLVGVFCAAIAVAQDVTVKVGGDLSTQGGLLQFIPPAVTAQNGSVITFVFSGNPGNHSVTQSSFDDPCQPLSGGFDSGFVNVPAGTYDGFPTWNLTVTNDAVTIWFYSAQTLPLIDCTAGMVGSVNAPLTGNESFLAFEQVAKDYNATQFSLQTPTPSLNGIDASASAPPGPLSGNVTGYGLPTTSSLFVSPSSTTYSSGGSSLTPGSGIGFAMMAFIVWMCLRTWELQPVTLGGILAGELAIH